MLRGTGLVLHADHGFNASTFTSLVVISTLSDLYSACSAAVGALRGPLHGGANEGVMVMLNESGDMDKVDEFMKGKLERKEKIMGFGHRVYKAYDPRATYLKTFAEGLARDTGNLPLYEMSKRIEEITHEAVADKGIFPNVDFYSGIILKALGIPTSMFTVIFAVGRTVGWVAHWNEMIGGSYRIGRPRQLYTGYQARDFVSVENR